MTFNTKQTISTIFFFFSECAIGFWGTECSNICNCSQFSTGCDGVSGCICNIGWEGRYCDVNIDECNSTIDVCGALEDCADSEGSYACECKSGYQREANGTCTSKLHLDHISV